MKISIYNRQKDLKIYKKLVRAQIKKFLSYENITCDELAVHYVKEEEISMLHMKFFKDPSPTDCISFPIDPPNNSICFLGEIFICPKTAIEYNKKEPQREISLYLVHSLLHLIGYEDISIMGRRAIRKREKRHMGLLKKEDLVINKNIKRSA